MAFSHHSNPTHTFYIMNIIYTQYRENYGSHTWDGKGECPQHWKNKGGGTYVLDSSVDADDFGAAVSYINDYSAVFVTETVEVDELPEHDEWSPPVYVTAAVGDKFLCSRNTPNFEGDLFRSEIESKYESWMIDDKGGASEQTVVYTMTDGAIIQGSELNAYLESLTATN